MSYPNFVPRATFDVSALRSVKWYPHHMHKGLLRLRELAKKCDCLIELRDARIPRSSSNYNLTTMIPFPIPRVVAYNKKDLAEEAYSKKLIESDSLMIKSSLTNDIDRLMLRVRDLAPGSRKLLVIGIPNVGKSSLINALRRRGLQSGRRNAVPVGKLPGVTQHAGQLVRIHEDPSIYVLDTPGICLPNYEHDVVAGLRVAMTGGILDAAIDALSVADFSLFELNRLHKFNYVQEFGLEAPTNEINELIVTGVKKHNSYFKNGYPDQARLLQIFLRSIRDGRLGKLTLDR